ncbi:unnamed protein product [Urochloa decumbens]|uniref:Uncharacterized protein n=1 Tax=Urochloa decumbens TaxID=240449 RepID=A0ABC9E5L9_9POAL
MDLETENRLLVEETRRLRLQDDKEGVQAVSPKPGVTQCPNSRFLSATVVGIQQANQIAEADEMWHAREKKIGIKQDSRSLATSSLVKYSRSVSYSDSEDDSSDDELEEFLHPRVKRERVPYSDSEDELSDDDLEEFLHPRVKRRYVSSSDSEDSDDELEVFLRPRVKQGRGTSGSRMNEAGPDLTTPSGRKNKLPGSDIQVKGEREHQVQSPGKPIFLRSTYDCPSKRSITYDPCRGERRRSITYSPCRGEKRRNITYSPCRGERIRSITLL